MAYLKERRPYPQTIIRGQHFIHQLSMIDRLEIPIGIRFGGCWCWIDWRLVGQLGDLGGTELVVVNLQFIDPSAQCRGLANNSIAVMELGGVSSAIAAVVHPSDANVTTA